MKTQLVPFFQTFKHRILVLAVFILLLAACRPATKGGLPTCSPDSLQAPETTWPIYSPDRTPIDTLTPTFTWRYADTTCVPDHYLLEYADSIADLFGYASSGSDTVSQEVDGAALSWTVTSPLRPATMYQWRVSAVSGSRSEYFGNWMFFTGPQCTGSDPSALLAPTLVLPVEGTVRSTLTAFLEWDDPTTCIPRGNYLVELSASPSFTHPYWDLREIGMTNVGVGSGMEFDVPLRDCTQYYWRVRMDLDDRPESEDGPWSPTWSFSTNTLGGYCPLHTEFGPVTPIPDYDLHVTSEPSSWIEGHVWHDVCALPYESTDVAPPGCVWIDLTHGYEANGVYDTGEPGIAGVKVDLGSGACPSTEFATTTTASDGRYAFGPLAAGTYCVSIDATADANIPILLPGGWTFPVRDAPIAQYQIRLLDTDIRRGNDFGWDYQFLPAPSSASSTTTPAPSIPTATLLLNAYCLHGPAEGFGSVTTLLQGVQVPIEGRNQDATWWYVVPPNSQIRCWVAGSMVRTSGNVNGLPVVEAPPLGCWVSQQQGPKKCVAPCPDGAQPGGACEP